MRLLLPFLLAAAANAAILIQSNVFFDGVAQDPCSTAALAGCRSEALGGPGAPAPWRGTASAGVSQTTSTDGLSLLATVAASSNNIHATGIASLDVDAMFTFTGSLLVESPGIVDENFASARIIVDAPLYSGELPPRFQDHEFGRAWLIQPGVPVHIILQATYHRSGSDGHLTFGVIDPPLAAPEPGTWAAVGCCLTWLCLRRQDGHKRPAA